MTREETPLVSNEPGTGFQGMATPSAGAGALAKLRAANSDITGAALVTADGFAIEAHTASGIDEESLAAMAADLLARASRSSEEFGNGALDELYARGDGGYLIVVRAGPDQVIACLASSDATVGLLLRDVRAAAEQFA